MLKADDTTRSKYYNHKLDKFLDIFAILIYYVMHHELDYGS